MSDVTTLPAHGEVFLDARGGDRTLRISWHHDSVPDGVVVLSLWRSGLCVGSFRLRSREVPLLIDALARGLGGSWPGEAGFNQPADLAAPPPPQRPRPVPSDAGPGPAPGSDRARPLVAPAAQGESRPQPQPRPRQRPRPQPIPGPQPNPGQGPGEAGFNLPAEPAAPPPPRPQHLQPAAEPPVYNDVQPKPRRYLGGPPNSSGAESWSA